MQHQYRHLFGPVPSRRLGRSLGVDLVPFKHCSFDCIFCQLGRTTDKTVTRREYVPTDEVIDELAHWIDSGNTADAITLSGSGEPTLHSRFGEVITFVRDKTSIPMILLTNASLLNDPDVRRQAAMANVVKVSLSAWDQASLEQVNRPHPDIAFDDLLQGLRLLRRDLEGEMWMEVFLVWGTNATPAEVARIAELSRDIGPDRVQLNTAVRPPCEEYAYAVPADLMNDLAGLFTPVAEVIPEYSSESETPGHASEDDILNLIRRRPCTLSQICDVFGMHRNEATKYLGKFTRTGQATMHRKNNATYFAAVHDETVAETENARQDRPANETPQG